VKFDSPEKTTHNKIIISDTKIALIGSTNWTEMSLGYANEANVMIEDGKIAEYFQEYFNYLWKKSSKDISPFKSFRGEIVPLIDREYFDVVQATMKKAKRRIWVMVYGFKLSGSENTRADLLADEMIKAKKRGVEVKVILEKSDFNEWLNRMNGKTIEYFKENGIEAKLDNEDIITHAKVVIIDDSVFLGSTNWSYGGLELWHNSDILIRNKKIVDFFTNYFEEKFKE
jgi:phosphatidylserine/phosphatidylglycerophosphate/cardiolipin synthase-like enzyme